jgi:hypothetical protein
MEPLPAIPPVRARHVVTRRGAILLALMLGTAHAQEPPCCGPITPAGERLARFLDDSGVDHLWLAGWHVDWRTGAADRPEPGGPEAHTHCSAFVAAMADRLHVYILRPPRHPQELLANAQMRWLADQDAAAGWRPVADAAEAQALANRGDLVVASFENPDPRKPGHIAIIRPSLIGRDALLREGPRITQAGGTNHISTTLENGFRWRRPHVLFFAHAVRWA